MVPRLNALAQKHVQLIAIHSKYFQKKVLPQVKSLLSVGGFINIKVQNFWIIKVIV